MVQTPAMVVKTSARRRLIRVCPDPIKRKRPAERRPPLGCQRPGSFSSEFWLPRHVTHRSGRQPRAETCKKVVRVDLPRQEIVKWLRANGMREVADAAETELPDPVPPKVADRFCTAHGFSISTLMDRMGASP